MAEQRASLGRTHERKAGTMDGGLMLLALLG
ncbi:MAG: hypothetical protein FD124_3424, partial [Alphaproteobacteria bacterium]